MPKPNWKIVTPAQHKANKANAQASTGPRTEAGKRTSAANATMHGLTSKQAVLQGEDPAEFEQFRVGMQQSFHPQGERELAAFEEYVLSTWRIRRCRRTEAALLNECVRALTAADPRLTSDQALARVFCDDAYQKKINLFLRYQAAIERAAAKSFKELLALQADRRQEERIAKTHAQRATPPAKSEPAASMRENTAFPQPFDGFVSQAALHAGSYLP